MKQITCATCPHATVNRAQRIQCRILCRVMPLGGVCSQHPDRGGDSK